MNQNGEAFGLFAALPDGTVIPLNATSQARLQVIHNAADPAAASVDVYVNGVLTVPGFNFRTATPFIDVPGDVVLNIGIAGAGSTSVNDTIVNIPVQLTNGQTYLAIASGVLNPASFSANPDGIATGFQLLLQDNIRESAVNSGDVDFIVIHGATDAPTVDVVVNGGGPILVDNAAYTDITPYLNVPAASYTLDITPGNDNSTIVATYLADLTALAGGSAVVFASGFLDPGSNQNGEGFGVWVTLADGSTFPLPVVTSVSEIQETADINMYPNPVSSGNTVQLQNNNSFDIEVEVLNSTGQLIFKDIIESNNMSYILNTASFATGLYFVKTNAEGETNVNKLIVQ